MLCHSLSKNRIIITPFSHSFRQSTIPKVGKHGILNRAAFRVQRRQKKKKTRLDVSNSTCNHNISSLARSPLLSVASPLSDPHCYCHNRRYRSYLAADVDESPLLSFSCLMSVPSFRLGGHSPLYGPSSFG